MEIDALRIAWSELAPERPKWPATFEACMADPIIARELAIAVRRKSMARAAVRRVVTHVTLAPLPAFDPKRAAAGDIDKDE